MDNKPPVWQMVKEAVESIGGNVSYSDIKQFIKDKYGDVNDSTITCQIIVSSVNHPSRIHYPENKKPRTSDSRYDFLFNIGRGQVETYDPEKHGLWEIKENEYGKLVVAKKDEEPPLDGEAEDLEEKLAFPFESHLRDFIARNIESIKINNQSLRLYIDDSGRDGVEYPTEVGPIDILAIDQEDNFVVFELKLGRGSDRALGQLLRYMGCIQKKLAADKKVRGVIVAKSASENLKYAASVTPEISLFEYELNFAIRCVDS